MRITFDQAKRDQTLAERGLDFADAVLVFEGCRVGSGRHSKELRRTTHHLLWPVERADGRRGLHTAWRGSPRFQHEESQ